MNFWPFKKRPIHTVKVKERKDGFGWNERGVNNKITCSSESFTRHEDAIRAAEDHCFAKRVYIAAPVEDEADD